MASSSFVSTRTSRTPIMRWMGDGSTLNASPAFRRAAVPGGITKVSARVPAGSGADARSPDVRASRHRAGSLEPQRESDGLARRQRALEPDQHEVIRARLELDARPGLHVDPGYRLHHQHAGHVAG